MYVGGGLGVATTDTDHHSYKIFAGYQFVQFLRMEIAYNNFGKLLDDGSPVNINLSTVGLILSSSF
jgi:hypothetical protein